MTLSPDATAPVCWVDTARNPLEFLTPDMQAEICREDGSLHRLYQALSAWPAPMLPAHKFYQAILHAPDSPLDLNTAEFVATHVAILTSCAYARAHHGENFLKTSKTRALGKAILADLENDDLASPRLSPRFRAMAAYTRKLTRTPDRMEEADIQMLRLTGLSDAEIVQVNQIAASFAYWTRMINGLGISLGAEAIGLTANTLTGIRAQQG